jgi:ribosomal protein L11 methyltransferase
MPYRIDIQDAGDDAFDTLVELGALDVEPLAQQTVAAVMPDSVAPADIARALGGREVSVSPATGRDADSIWTLRPRRVQIGRIQIAPADTDAEPGVLRLIDAPAFGTGLHPTTALCLEALDEALDARIPDAVLDVGTGSGVLALAALMLGVPHATALDVDEESLRAAAENARLNRMHTRLALERGGPEAATGTWPLVLANIAAASLTDMAATLVRRVGHEGQVVLSGFSVSLEPEVAHAYTRLGMRRLGMKEQAGWVALVLDASW